MRKNYFLFFLTLFTTLLFSQKVSLTPTVVNGSNYSSGPINLGVTSNSTITLGVKVELPNSPGDNGTITIYYEKAPGAGSIIPTGGNPRNLFFGGGKIGLSNFVIQLILGQFNTSGGYMYAEYKTPTGVTYKSSNIAIIKDGVAPPPSPIPSPEFPIQYIPHGATPLLPNYNFNTNTTSHEWINSDGTSLGIDSDKRLYNSSNLLYQKNIENDGSFYTTKKLNISVQNFLPNLPNLSVNNTISSNQYLAIGEKPQTIIGNQATESHTESIPGQRRNITVTNPLKNYQWQVRTKFPLDWNSYTYVYFNAYNWKDIPGATQINYTPPITNEGMEYRRLILENPAPYSDYRRASASNVINIITLLEDPSKNTICCNQTVKSGDLTSPITGNANYRHAYQWQISTDGINWEEIFLANHQNYTPYNTSQGGRRGQYDNQSMIQYYRRINFDVYSKIYYTSNTIKITFESIANTANESIKIYPNPTSSILNIENTRSGQTMSDITIINETGNKVLPNSNSIINQNLIKLDVSNLSPGIYFLNIMRGSESSSRSSEGSSRSSEGSSRSYGYQYQTKFIKQ